MLFAAVMTKIEGRKDDSLLRTYGFRGFPSMAILDASGEAVTKKVDRSLGGMKTAVNAAGKYVKLKAKVDAGEDYDKKAWFLAQLGLGQLTADEAKGCAAELGLQGKEAKHVDGIILAMELTPLMRRPNGGGQVYKMWKNGRRLNADASDGHHNFFAVNVASQAMESDDAEAFRFAVARARTAQQTNIKRYKDVLPRIARDRKRFANNDRMLTRLDSIENNYKNQIKSFEQKLADMAAFEKKIANVKKEGK